MRLTERPPDKEILKLEIIKKILVSISIAVTFKFGITVMIVGMIITSWISFYLNSYYIGVLVSYAPLQQLRDIALIVIASLCMAIVTMMLPGKGELSPFLFLSMQIMFGVITYLIACFVLRIPVFMELFEYVLSLRRVG